MTEENSDRLWKRRKLWEIPKNYFKNFTALPNIWP